MCMNENDLPLVSITAHLAHPMRGRSITELVRKLTDREPPEDRVKYYEDIVFRDGPWVKVGRTSIHKWKRIFIAPSHDDYPRLKLDRVYTKVAVRSLTTYGHRESALFDAVLSNVRGFAKELVEESWKLPRMKETYPI